MFMKNSPIEYNNAMKIMHEIAEKVKKKEQKDTIWFLEHEDVYTNKIIDKDRIKNIPYIKTDRGGKITYHGPGQLIAYFILDIEKKFSRDVNLYVNFLEQIVINSLKKIKIEAERRKNLIGVWIGVQKICSIGVRVKNGITIHGIALNVSTDLDFFKHIAPCGIENVSMCSIKSLGFNASMTEMINIMQNEIQNYLKDVVFLRY